MASYEEYADSYDLEDPGEEEGVAIEEDEEDGDAGDDEKAANPDDIRFGWGEMVFLTMVVVPAELLSLLFKATALGYILGVVINIGISAFLFIWLYFIHGSTGNRFVKKMITKIAIRKLVIGGFVSWFIPLVQTISLFWLFLEARSEAVRLATRLAEKAYAKGRFS